MPSLPVGTVTFLFTDIEGSTRLVQALGGRYRSVLETHHAILRRAIGGHGGTEVSTEGDAFFAVFPSAREAVDATVGAQLELQATKWPDEVEILVRMGLHTGDGELGGDNYVGVDVHRAARIAAAGHGGQVLLSASTRALVEPTLPDGVRLRDLGEHRLKDLQAPERVHQLVIAGLAADFPALRSLDASSSNLAPPATALIGRERELGRLSELLAATRLLTLTGPGGTGKTRLALELGGQAGDQFSDGVIFVPLETYTERPMVAAAVAEAIGVRAQGQHDPEDVIIGYLGDRKMLLILDNFEQLVDVVPLVAKLLAGAAGLRIVATSRVPLHLSEEQEYPVPPLAVPAEESLDLEALSRVEAVALFVERARRVQPDFRLTDANAAAVAAICRRLDGLPLAIELAAARVKVLSPAMILGRLDHALPMLAGGGVDLPARQRTLRAAIDWSRRLLDEGAQALFARLTVFSGGWTIEAAEQVAAPEELALDLLDSLSGLVDHSLVRPAADSSDEPRFEMLGVIREYGAERLAERDDAASTERRHAEWALAFIEAEAPALEAGVDLARLDWLGREHDNLRAALAWSVRNDEREIGLRLATAAWRFWQQRGHIVEGRGWFDRLLPADQEPETLETRLLAAAHTAAGGLAYWQSALDEADAHYRSALDLDRRFDRRDRLGDDMYNLGFVSMTKGDLDSGRREFTESAELFAAAGQSNRLADTTSARGALESRAGNLEAARDLMEEGRRLNLQQGNRRRGTDNIMVLSHIYLGLGDLATARERLLTALTETLDEGDAGRWPLLLDAGSAIEEKAGRPSNALRLAAASAKRRAKIGGGPSFIVDVEHVVAEARAAVSELADQAWSEGERLDDDAVVALLRGADKK